MPITKQPIRIIAVILLLSAATLVLLTTTQPFVSRSLEPSTEPARTPEPVERVLAPPSNNELAQHVSSGPSVEQSVDAILENGFVIDHQSVALFEQIPDSYVNDARNLRMLFSDRSVGQNIHEALDCLTATSWADSPASCRRDYYDTNWNWKTFSPSDLENGLVPERIVFDPDPVKYDRSNWSFELKAGSWSQLTQDFIQVLAPAYINSKDVLSYQFSYLNVDASSDIVDPDAGFFADNEDKYDIYDLEAYIAQHPDKVFIFWTTSLARSIGSQQATDFNNQMRQYALTHDKVLFDVADILSHTDQGAACYDNRDGIQYCTPNGNCENHPDDGKSLLAICQDYTTELEGGHLGTVSGAKIRVAKAFWVLMARVAGWDGVGTSPATSTPTPTMTGTRPADSPTPTTTSTPTPTITGTRPANSPTPTTTTTTTTTPTPTLTVTGTPPTVTPTPIVTVTPTPISTSPNGTIPPLPSKVYVPAASNQPPGD